MAKSIPAKKAGKLPRAAIELILKIATELETSQ